MDYKEILQRLKNIRAKDNLTEEEKTALDSLIKDTEEMAAQQN